MNFAKKDAAKTFLVGPILDSAGAAVTGALTATDVIKVTKNGTVGAADAQDTLTHNHTGHYVFVSDGGDFDTVGEVEFSLNSGTNAMAPVKFQVLPAAIYDSIVAGTATADGLVLGSAAYKLAVDSAGKVAVPDTQKVDVNTIKTATVAASSTVTFANGTVSTLTQPQVSGGAYDLTNSTFVAAFKSALGTVPASGNWATVGAAMTLADGSIVTATFGTCDFTSSMKTSLNAATPASVQNIPVDGTLKVDVTNWKTATAQAMTGDAYARIGAAGAGLTAVPMYGDLTAEMKASVTDAVDGSTMAGTVANISE